VAGGVIVGRPALSRGDSAPRAGLIVGAAGAHHADGADRQQHRESLGRLPPLSNFWQTRRMNGTYLRRRLWYVDLRDPIIVEQDFLRTDPRSLVVLGEAGMGKSTLLMQLKDVDGFAVCTARKLIITPDPKLILGGASTLVVDALDEVSAQREGDAVDLILKRLAELGLPRFILSCRVSDWRSATALQGIADFYDRRPLELHLDPLARDDAIAFLAATLGVATAEETIDHLEVRGLKGLWNNPQTLELVGKVVEKGKLPQSKGELFEDATKLLRAEHRKEKAGSPLTSLPEAEVLDAAGAGFAALILTGKDAMSREVHVEESDTPIAELSALPEADRINDVLDSRLFEARAPERFSYAHRAIGEFLGARWLGKQANTPRKQRRLRKLFTNQVLVPASLRGIHAWLAWHSPALANQIITTDPMGVIEYGDADTLSAAQGRTLLEALYTLSRENPRFRDWSEYRVGALAQPALLPEVRGVLNDQDAEFGLRLLILQALKGSRTLPELRDDLLVLLLDDKEVFAVRSAAGYRLTEFDNRIDWPLLLQQLIQQNSESSIRLASELMDKIGYAQFDDALVIEMIKAQFQRLDGTIGVFFRLERNFPRERLDALLDGIAATARALGDRHEHSGDEIIERNDAITDLVFMLLARRLSAPPPEASALWSWLEPIESHVGVQRETRQAVAEALERNDALRRAVQRHVLLEQHSDKNIWERSWRMLESSSGLRPSEADICALLDQLDHEDPRWRELVELVRHGPDDGASVRAAAARFVESKAADQIWLAQLAEPRVPQWQIEQEERQRQRAAKRQADWDHHRAEFTVRIDAMRSGEYGAVINPAKAYLHLFHDIGDESADGPGRIEEWLGRDLRDAALVGFEAFLRKEPPLPTATTIATSHAEGRRWEAAFIIVAALAERLRTGRGFDDLPDERVMAGYFELSHTPFDKHAGIAGLDKRLADLLRARGQWEATQRLFFEPQLTAGAQHVRGLYALMRSTEDDKLVDKLGAEWLESFPNMSSEAEVEIIDRLLATPAGCVALRALLPRRLETAPTDQRRRTWNAVGLILEFEATRARLEAAGEIDKKLFWDLRDRLGDRRGTASTASLDTAQLDWVIRTFRTEFPYTHWPVGTTTGDTNGWDATHFLLALINRLGDEVSPAATEKLVALRDAPEDGYTGPLRVALAEQKRKRVEAGWKAPDLPAVAAAIMDQAPTTAAQLQAVLLEELVCVQAKIRGSDVDWYKDFFVGGVPRNEEACRDTILKMFGELPFGIQAIPEGHLADDKRCDIFCTLAGMMVPIELKGQWHKDLWTAADRQLDLLYTNDWRAERGIYVVLWFGRDSSKPPCKPSAGIKQPETAESLRAELAAQSVTTREGRTEIVVLDLTRPV
jgi:hypothetical protein